MGTPVRASAWFDSVLMNKDELFQSFITARGFQCITTKSLNLSRPKCWKRSRRLNQG